MAVLVSCDLLYIVDALRDRVRELVKQSLPEIDPKSVVLNATHTHNSAETYTDPDLGRKLNRLGLDVPEAWSAWGINLGVMSPSEYTEFACRADSRGNRAGLEGAQARRREFRPGARRGGTQPPDRLRRRAVEHVRQH